MDDPPTTGRIEIPPRTVAGGFVVTPRSHLIDRYRAECAHIFLQPRDVEGGQITYQYGSVKASPPPRRMPWLRGKPQTVSARSDRLIVDMRANVPGNFAHFLNTHLPTFFHLSSELGLDWDRVQLLVPEESPPHVMALAEMFGLDVWPTNAVVTGQGLLFEVTPWTALRSSWAAWAGAAQPQQALAAAIEKATLPDLPDKIFLSRRGSRVLKNAPEVEAWLEGRGFTTVYGEDHAVVHQIAMFRSAREIVAIHGAGIAPLLYCTAGHRPRSFVELQPVGIMADVYRDMATQVGCAWVGVQGKIEPGYVPGLYDLEKNFTEHAFDDFEIDIASLEEAFEILETNSHPNLPPVQKNQP